MTDQHVTTQRLDSTRPLEARAAQPRRLACVLFDFDGPICDLFSGHAAPDIAAFLLAGLPRDTRQQVVTDEPLAETDPQRILNALGPRDTVWSQWTEQQLVGEELKAARTAAPTPGAGDLIRALDRMGVSLAITTNNAKSAVERYLSRPDVGLAGLFGEDGEHVHGRSSDLTLRKPHPDCLSRALASTEVEPEEALMIGDAVADREAAASLGVAFLGYAKDAAKRHVLEQAGAMWIVDEELPTTFEKLVEVCATFGPLASSAAGCAPGGSRCA